jgi:hypothetical protein
MLIGSRKPDQAWKTRTYPVPMPSRSGFRWKASALRRLHRFDNGSGTSRPATIMVPALYNFMPGESVAMGWLNEIDALVTIRQRMLCAAKITGWDIFTFHTLHNRDRYYDTTIAAVRDTWVKEGNLSPAAVLETTRQFSKPYDYFRIPARLVENLVFQSALLDWVGRRAADVPLRFHAIGTALLSALVASGSVPFGAAVESALKFGSRWEQTMAGTTPTTTDETGWSRFEELRRLMEGQSGTATALAVAREDLPQADAPSKPFWYSPTVKDDPVLITTAREASTALETLNLSSWGFATPIPLRDDESVRGWLVSSLQPFARLCRWSVSNYLLANPASVSLFIDHIATLGRTPALQLPQETVSKSFPAVQNESHRALIR